MTHKEKFIKALKREKITGHVPHFELAFFLTMESLGMIHPQFINYSQWNQMTKVEQQLYVKYSAKAYIETAKKYDHSAIFLQDEPSKEHTIRIIEEIREQTGDEYFLMLHGDPTFAIPDGETMMDFTERMFEDEDGLKAEAQKSLDYRIDITERMYHGKGLVDGFALCADYCFNTNPFFSPDMFDEYIGPYLEKVLKAFRDMGFYSIKHSDGNIMPILDKIVDCKPDAVHSLDPQGGVSLKEVKEKFGDRVCLIGNVNCGLMQTGTEEECIADVRRALRDGMPGYGYIFSTSNTAYTGMPLERYELMHKIWREEGIYE